jgi:Cu+-exporting ATPase
MKMRNRYFFMHYIPESTLEMLRGESPSLNGTTRVSFHYQSAPLYLLTTCVTLLLLGDWVSSLGLMSLSVGGTSIGGSVIPQSLWGCRLALLAAVLGGMRILYHALDGLLSGRFGADLALMIACLAAIAVGEHQTAGLVVLISLVGESVEGYTLDCARWAMQQTFTQQPTVAHLATEGRERDVPLADLRVGDVVIVRPGERIPVDGRILSGSSWIDQSAFSGESVPLDKSSGDLVFAGTLNQSGALTLLTESLGQQTALARVSQLVAQAQLKKSDLERTADRLARGFLPAVVGSALLTWLAWRIGTGSWQRGILPALGVLVVACPCPLILATPCAVMAAMAWLARQGVVLKSSKALEQLADVDTFAFDKTGTLTQGTLILGAVTSTSDYSSEDILRIAASAERHSEHLLARLIVRSAEERGLALTAPAVFETLPGAGVVAQISAQELSLPSSSPPQPTTLLTIVVGNRRTLDRGDIVFSDHVDGLLKSHEIAGESMLVVAVEGHIVGLIGIRETIRPESAEVLQQLRRAGISQFALLTGDRPQPADAVVRSIGLFDHVATDQLPADKATWIKNARGAGRRVAMVGDGVNDAPALAAANVGLVLGRVGADLAAEAGEILLLGDPLRPLPGLLRLSRALVQNIRQSILYFAFGLNGIGVLACVLGFLTPVSAALFHEAASLAVMANALQLLWFDRWRITPTTRFTETLLKLLHLLTLAASPTLWVYWTVSRWQLCVKLAAAMVLAVWFVSGVVQLSESEQGLVTRFGRYEATLTAGLHWRWPRPLEHLTRVPIDPLRSVGIGFRANPTGGLAREIPNFATAPTAVRQSAAGDESPTALSIVEWTSSHGDHDAAAMSDESLLMTSEEVPVELTAELLYRVKDPQQFSFRGTRLPDDVLRAAAESVLRDIAAVSSLDDMLTDRRAALERHALSRLRQRMEGYSLGIEIVDLQWLDIHPPKAVVPAYRQVADALEDRELLINEADAYADRVLLGAVGEQSLRVLQHSADDSQRPPVCDATAGRPTRDPSVIGKRSVKVDLQTAESFFRRRADWTLSDSLWDQLTRAEADGFSLLSGNAAATMNEAHVLSAGRRASASANALRMEQLHREYRRAPELTNQRLYWNAVIESLSPRNLTIVDPKAVVKQHLWFGDVPLSPPAVHDTITPTPAAEK